MDKSYSPSVNIIRDAKKTIDYVATPNAKKAAHTIMNDFQKGIHSFSIIGSYGTGKSSFLWALQQDLSRDGKDFFEAPIPKGIDFVHFQNFVGSYESIIGHFKDVLGVSDVSEGNQEIFDALYQLYEDVGIENGLLVIQIDEMGKFLEYAVKNNPGKELYFIQQLAEFVGAESRNMLFLSTLHQSFDAYGLNLSQSEKNEWRKIKGRLVDIPFNEPIEQLLFLAAERINGKPQKKDEKTARHLAKLISDSALFTADPRFLEEAAIKIFPLDIIAAYSLTAALQKYGQNERSLFSFLAHLDLKPDDQSSYSISEVYDYLYINYYSFLSSRGNPDFIQWSGIRSSVERSETRLDRDIELAISIVKAIGLLNLFSHRGSSTDLKFYQEYFSTAKGVSKKNVTEIIDQLVKKKIIRFQKFDNSFKLFDGTDIDIEGVLQKAENDLDGDIDLLSKLKDSFEFPILTAKSISYRSGTPRLFEFIITGGLDWHIPCGEIDGFIQLVFSDQLDTEDVMNKSHECDEAILFCLFNNTEQIKESLLQIERSKRALASIEFENDQVANREIKSIIASHKSLLNHFVLDALFSNKVTWVFDGEIKDIDSSKQLNRLLSKICEEVYSKTPVLRNELYNKHKISTAIHSARKNFFRAMTNNWKELNLGYPADKFPPDKAIYYSLLKDTGLHRKINGELELVAPKKDSSLHELWAVSENFMISCRQEKRSLTDLYRILEQKPFKLKRGVTDFWVPIFLFLKRGDYALYGDTGFIPHIDDTRLHLITRSPKEYEIKSFELTGARIQLFNRYRKFLNLSQDSKLSNESFIESIRPILVLFRGLTEYSRNTKRLSKGTLALRDAISKAQDPEAVFFDDFPKALGYSLKNLADSDEAFEEYILSFQEAIDELNRSYEELVNRLENFIQSEIVGSRVNFEEYKDILQERYQSIKDHKLLKHQKTFILRLNSPIDDRNSWIESIAHAVIGKRLQDISDTDEDLLKDNLKHLVVELDNLTVIVRQSDSKSETFKVDFTTKAGGMKERVIRIPANKVKVIESKIESLKKALGNDKESRIAILSSLLKQELYEE